MLNFCDLIEVYVFTTNHHLNASNIGYQLFGTRVTGNTK